MYEPITSAGFELATLALDPIMDAPTALHCSGCGETLALNECHNVNCPDAAEKASRASGATMIAPRAWTLGGRVD